MATQASAAAHPAPQSGTGGEPLDYLNAEKGWYSWASTVDHKRIGIMYLFSVMAMFGVGGFFALALRTELLTSGPTIPRIPFILENGMTADIYNRAFTLLRQAITQTLA